MTTNAMKGRFMWHETMTTDGAASAKFYGDLLGWTSEEMPMGPAGTYRLFSHGGKQIGGGMTAPPGVPSHWFVYVGVDDVDATAAAIEANGGKIMVPPTDVPDMLRFAIAMDPQGAPFGIMTPLGPQANDAPPEGPPAVGTFCWDELHTSDQQAAGKFYGAIFGWMGKVGEDAMKYWHWQNQGKDIGGMMTLQAPNVPPHWLTYIAVDDVDASTARAQEIGGKLLMPAMAVEHVGKLSVVQDPTGAAFALFKSARG